MRDDGGTGCRTMTGDAVVIGVPVTSVSAAAK
jgi:hypothetical protein